MRGPLACAVLLGAVGVVAANAADFPGGHGSGSGSGAYSSFGTRIEPVIVYDFEPGVIVRSYWYAPWQNRHYFPKTGRPPKVGRRELIPAHRVSSGEDYYRFWSVSSVFLPEVPSGIPRQFYFPSAPATPQP
jgi:hypothetical protein